MTDKGKCPPSAAVVHNRCPHVLQITPTVKTCGNPRCTRQGAKEVTFHVRFSRTPEDRTIHVNNEELSFRVRPALCGGTLKVKLGRLKRITFDPDKELTAEQMQRFTVEMEYHVEGQIGNMLKVRLGHKSSNKKQTAKDTPRVCPAGSPTKPCWSFDAGRNRVFDGPCPPFSIVTRRSDGDAHCTFSYEFTTTNTGDWVVEHDILRFPFWNPLKRLMARCLVIQECKKTLSSYHNNHRNPSKGAWKCPAGCKRSTAGQ